MIEAEIKAPLHENGQPPQGTDNPLPEEKANLLTFKNRPDWLVLEKGSKTPFWPSSTLSSENAEDYEDYRSREVWARYFELEHEFHVTYVFPQYYGLKAGKSFDPCEINLPIAECVAQSLELARKILEHPYVPKQK